MGDQVHQEGFGPSQPARPSALTKTTVHQQQKIVSVRLIYKLTPWVSSNHNLTVTTVTRELDTDRMITSTDHLKGQYFYLYYTKLNPRPNNNSDQV